MWNEPEAAEEQAGKSEATAMLIEAWLLGIAIAAVAVDWLRQVLIG